MASISPRISVVIPSCNGERHLPDCLRSLEAQTLRDFEVIVVENGSEDRTAEIVATDFPWVRLIRLEGKQGFSRPVNVGWRAAQSDLIFVLNDDTVCNEKCLEELVSAASTHDGTGSFAALMVYFEAQDTVNSAGHRLMGNGTVVEDGIGEPASGEYVRPREVFGACAGAALYRRALLEDLGGFDEDFWIINEDVDLDFRAQLREYRCRSVPQARVAHRVSQFMGVGSPRMIHAYTKNLALYMIKDLPPAYWGRFRMQVLAHLWKSSSALVREGHWRALVRARWDLMRMGLRMLRKRRAQARELMGGGPRIVEWVERGAATPPAAVPSVPGKFRRNALPAFVALLLLLPLLFWLGLAMLQDHWMTGRVRPRSDALSK